METLLVGVLKSVKNSVYIFMSIICNTTDIYKAKCMLLLPINRTEK
jgi:hypothetical protein